MDIIINSLMIGTLIGGIIGVVLLISGNGEYSGNALVLTILVSLLVGTIIFTARFNSDMDKTKSLLINGYETTHRDYVEIINADIDCKSDDILETDRFSVTIKEGFGTETVIASVRDNTKYIEDSSNRPYIVIGKLYYNARKYHVLEVHY